MPQEYQILALPSSQTSSDRFGQDAVSYHFPRVDTNFGGHLKTVAKERAVA
jgi:hypothetical protein